eukprot:3891367-Prymnesium_polylepis.1
MKQVKRQKKYWAADAAAEAADTTIRTSPTSQDAAATKEGELEEQSAADAEPVDEEGAQEKRNSLCPTSLKRALEHCPTAPNHA